MFRSICPPLLQVSFSHRSVFQILQETKLFFAELWRIFRFPCFLLAVFGSGPLRSTQFGLKLEQNCGWSTSPSVPRPNLLASIDILFPLSRLSSFAFRSFRLSPECPACGLKYWWYSCCSSTIPSLFIMQVAYWDPSSPHCLIVPLIRRDMNRFAGKFLTRKFTLWMLVKENQRKSGAKTKQFWIFLPVFTCDD